MDAMNEVPQSPYFGMLQDLVDHLFRDAKEVNQLDAIMEAEIIDLPADLQEVVGLLPPDRYNRQRFATQLNSILSAHGWSSRYGSVY